MFAQILNRSWKISPAQGATILNDELTRRKVLVGGSMLSIGAALAACSGLKIDVATLAPTIVEYITNIAAALKTALAGVSSVVNLPSSVTSVLTTIGALVSNISTVAGGITTSTLVSTATGGISSILNDFNQIVTQILSSPVVSTALSATSFGWAVYAAVPLLTLIEQAVNIVVNIVNPPTPAPVATVPTSLKMGARIGARGGSVGISLDKDTANEILLEIVASGR